MDFVISGIISGILAGTIHGIIHFLFGLFNIFHKNGIWVDAAIFMPNYLDNTISWFIVGFFVNLLLGAIIGVLLTYFLYATGEDYALFKGAFFGVTVSLILRPMAGILGEPVKQGMIGVLLWFINDMLFGIIAAYISVLLKNKTRQNI